MSIHHHERRFFPAPDENTFIGFVQGNWIGAVRELDRITVQDLILVGINHNEPRRVHGVHVEARSLRLQLKSFRPPRQLDFGLHLVGLRVHRG